MTTTAKLEAMTQAAHAATFAAQHLCECLAQTGAVEGRAILSMIEQAATLARACDAMLADMEDDARSGGIDARAAGDIDRRSIHDGLTVGDGPNNTPF